MNENKVRTDTYENFKTDLKAYDKPWKFYAVDGYIWFAVNDKDQVAWDVDQDVDPASVQTKNDLCYLWGIACW